MELLEAVVKDLKAELELTEADKFSEPLLRSKAAGALSEIKAARKYPDTYTEAMIEQDLENYYSVLRSITLFDYNQIGSEGQTSYSADGTSIRYVDRAKLFYGVLPLVVL